MSKNFPLIVFAAAVMPALAVAQDPAAVQKELAELKARVGELEDQQAKTSERIGGRAVVQAYTARSLDFGGHVTSVFTSMSGENGTATGHAVTVLELFLRAQIDDQWSLFATPGFYTFNGALLDNPATFADPSDPTFVAAESSEAQTFLSRIYGQWKYSDALQVQGGIVGSPHGTTNREYFIPARTIAQANLHTRYFMANTLYPQVVEGVRGLGKMMVGDGANYLEYDAYFGGEDDSPDDLISGARLAYVFGDVGLSVAANYGRGTRTGSATPGTNFGALQSPFPPSFNTTRDYQFGGIDVDWRQGNLISKTEAYYSAEEDYEDQRAFSTEWTYFVSPQWGLSYRFDYYDSGSDFNILASAVTPRGHSTEHTIGVCYNPNESVRLRLDLARNLLPDTDETVDFVNLSWSLSF